MRHAMGVVGVLLAVWGAGFIYVAATTAYAVWWDQGVIGAACLIGALLIYRRWFRAQ